MLRIAVQAKGRLFEETMALLEESDIKLSTTKRTLLVQSSNFPVEVLFLRDDDIPQSVATGVADLGIVGENEFVERQEDAEIIKRLGFSKCRLSLAMPKDIEYPGLSWFNGKKIATSYPGILDAFMKSNGVKAEVHVITGSVEVAPGIGLADAIFDIVSSGSTLVSNRLKEVEVVMRSEALLIGNKNMSKEKKEILDELLFRMDAVKTAETTKKEALLEVKEESIKTKNDLEKETKERRAELQRYEKRVLAKEEAVDKRSDVLEHRESKLTAKEDQLRQREAKVEELNQKRVQELERISGLTSEQAKEYLLKTVEEDVKHDTAKMVRELETQAKEEADKKAKEYVVNAIQRCAADHVAETTISVVQLPSDEMKGRIIGREGRNIRTLETLTGVELIIDDTPEAVVLSGFDPIRREVARIALERLIVDGRIHPARIEEMVEKAQKEVDTMIREEGEAAALEVGVPGIHPELIRLLGRMKFRTSYGQNALKHSIEVAQLSGLLAGEIGIDVRMAKRAGLLHDIGKSIDHDVEGSHIQIGVDLCRKYKESSTVINAVESHHGDVEPQTLIACVVQAADTISAARPGARRETIETYTNRLKQLEDITNQFKGVDKSFAIQAGREIRVMVVPEQVSDDDMVLMARDIAKQIEFELEYPGQIKVNVIRESRATDYAK